MKLPILTVAALLAASAVTPKLLDFDLVVRDSSDVHSDRQQQHRCNTATRF